VTKPPALREAASLDSGGVFEALGSSPSGLTAAQAERRLEEHGPNSIGERRVRAAAVLWRQLRNPLLILLVVTAVASLAFGERADAYIIFAIIALSVGLGFANEYRSEKAMADLHRRVRHSAIVVRDGASVQIEVAKIVPGDVVSISVGDIVPADLRLFDVNGLECDQGVLTGESLPSEKSAAPCAAGTPPAAAGCWALMGTIVRSGSGKGVAVATGRDTAFGAIAASLARHPPETAFQIGLGRFSGLLVRVTIVLTGSIFIVNAALGHPLLDSLLFSLAIAVGLTPQLLPAIVTVSLATGAQRLAKNAVIVKRLVSIEDLGNIDVLFTDKTGTLTEGAIAFDASLDSRGNPSEECLRLALACNDAVLRGDEVVGGTPLDAALVTYAARRAVDAGVFVRIASAPFDYERRLMSVLVKDASGTQTIVTKGAPEAVLAKCSTVAPESRDTLAGLFAAGRRVVAVAARDGSGRTQIRPSDERDLELRGFVSFADPVKADARESLERLRRLGIDVRVITGDNEKVAEKVCGDIGLDVAGVLIGSEIEALDDAQLREALPGTTIFARVTPDQKSRVIRLQRQLGSDVGFLGDGVNDAVALHDADVGISVDSGADVAKDAADIVLLEKDLGVLAGGVTEGRRIFANTIKYVLMGTSSNFGNMFSAAGASLFLTFLPMTAPQILLNNLLYDVGEMTIPTDNVDEELLAKPSHWDIGFIRRFMLLFGPISSVFDFATFGVMLWIFHASPALFRSGWFVESLLTQTLIIFAIRTRRVPFFRSTPSVALLATSLAVAATGAAIPFTPLAGLLGFVALPAPFFAILLVMIAAYLLMVEGAKRFFYRPLAAAPQPAALAETRRVGRLAARWIRH
jgi:P-type Mg2+ transporter